MATWEQTLAHILETAAADVAIAIKADERYAPIVATLTEKALAELAALTGA
jgi:hypothetical protein